MAEQRWWGNHVHELLWQLEASRLLADPLFYGHGVPRGSGRPVLLLPGFLAGDGTLAPLACWLARIGYRPRTAGFLFNVACSERALGKVAGRARALSESHGVRIAVVGHSRGGHYVRALAARHPELVSHAVSVGGGIVAQQAISAPTRAAVDAVARVHRHTTRRGCLTETCTCGFAASYGAPVPPRCGSRASTPARTASCDGSPAWRPKPAASKCRGRTSA